MLSMFSVFFPPPPPPPPPDMGPIKLELHYLCKKCMEYVSGKHSTCQGFPEKDLEETILSLENVLKLKLEGKSTIKDRLMFSPFQDGKIYCRAFTGSDKEPTYHGPYYSVRIINGVLEYTQVKGSV